MQWVTCGVIWCEGVVCVVQRLMKANFTVMFISSECPWFRFLIVKQSVECLIN